MVRWCPPVAGALGRGVNMLPKLSKKEIEGVIQSLCILVVDDNQYMRKLVRTLLVNCGVKDIFEASDGIAALDAIRTAAPDRARFRKPRICAVLFRFGRLHPCPKQRRPTDFSSLRAAPTDATLEHDRENQKGNCGKIGKLRRRPLS